MSVPLSRIDTILDLIDPTLPVWDLCCDRGVIGCAVLDGWPTTHVTFVEKRPAIVAALHAFVARRPERAGRYDVREEDVLRTVLPGAPASFVIAGVGTNLICAFLARLEGRRGDRVVCSTSQSPERFERLTNEGGWRVCERRDVSSRTGRQTVWVMEPVGRASG
jgi:tRNA A22 N-methylase